MRELEPALSEAVIGGALVPGGNVDNRRLCRALEIAIRRAGVRVVNGAEVTAVASSGGHVSGVDTATERFGADLVVLAAGAWSSNIRNVEPLPPVRPQRGQIRVGVPKCSLRIFTQ